MSLVNIGTSGWYYDHWKDAFYPAGLKKPDWLPFYASRFTTVEINATFYRLPFPNMIQGWRNKAPEGFVYAVKGSRKITHLRKLANVAEDLQLFMERVCALGDCLGPILWQLPPSLHRDDDRLDAFLAQLPRDQRHAVEFRHSSWYHNEVAAILRAHGAAFVGISSLRVPPQHPVTADFIYIRLHGLEGGYAHDYTEGELRPWAEFIRDSVADGLPAFAYFNNDGLARAPGNATGFCAMVERG